PSAMVITKYRKDLLEPLNVIVAERLSFVEQVADDFENFHMDKTCTKALFPEKLTAPTFVRINFYALSGAFMIFLCGSLLSIFVFIVENFFARVGKLRNLRKVGSEIDFSELV